MKYRKLGSTGLEVSEIGFGAWGVGGGVADLPAYGPADDRVSRSALRQAFDLGINFYDTSDLYGLGHSERLIGETFKDVRHQVVIATKVGFSGGGGAGDFSSENVMRSIDASLKRLQTDYVDLYQLHGPSIHFLEGDSSLFPALSALLENGKVRAVGISVRSPEDGLTAATELGFKALQVNFNLIDQRALGSGLLDLCHREDVGVIARTPLCFGFLTGAYSPDSKFDQDDHRSTWQPGQIALWVNAHRHFASVLGENHRQTAAQIALRFCLSYRGISTVIPGMLTREEVEENIAASEMGPFCENQLQEFERIYQDNTFFAGRD